MSYESDFYAWALEQAAALRRAANLPGIDLKHLADEIEGLGSETLAEIEGLIVKILAHLLKLEHCPDVDLRRHWRGEITAWRNAVRRRAKRSPSAFSRLNVAELYRDAVTELCAEFGDQPWGTELPADCPYAADQLLAVDWWPAGWRTQDDDHRPGKKRVYEKPVGTPLAEVYQRATVPNGLKRPLPKK